MLSRLQEWIALASVGSVFVLMSEVLLRVDIIGLDTPIKVKVTKQLDGQLDVGLQ